jgi:hypothetical protein
MPIRALIHKLQNAAKTRLIEKTKEKAKWHKEMAQVRILTSRGSVAYFLPDMELKGESGKRCADLVLDSVIVEMKTVSGSRVTLGGEFRLAFKQGAGLLKICPAIQKHSVFICLVSDISVGSVKAKIAGELKTRNDPGDLICYFEKTSSLYSWPYEELKALIGT